MKKSQHLIILCFVMFACFACDNSEKNNIKLEQINYTDKYYLSDDTLQGALTLSIQMELPISSISKETDSIRSFLIAAIFGDKYVQYINSDSILVEFAAELKEEYKTDNEPLLLEIENEEHFYSFDNDYVIEGFSLLNDDKIFSYCFDSYSYTGGAHGSGARTYYNFDAKTAQLITEKDLFADDYEAAIIELLKQKIVEDDESINTLADLEQSDYWVDSIKPNGNFFISDKAIIYIFNPYEIAPYYVGQTEVSLSFASLMHLLKQENPINYLVKK